MPQKRVRARLAFTPIWEGVIRGWAKKFISKNRWRCDSIHNFDDLLNDAYLTFIRVAERYPRVMDPPHFMALYKTAMRNEMHDRARYVQRKRPVHAELSDDVSDLFDDRMGEVTNGGHFNLLMAEAPPEVRLALTLLSEQPEALRDPAKRPKNRENLNMRLRRILGIEFDFVGAFKTLLAKEPT